jgi:hypothetical protein
MPKSDIIQAWGLQILQISNEKGKLWTTHINWQSRWNKKSLCKTQAPAIYVIQIELNISNSIKKNEFVI